MRFEYILILNEYFYRYVLLRACKNADADTNAETLIDYFCRFVPVSNWVSDKGPNYVNKDIENWALSIEFKRLFSNSMFFGQIEL